jgi:rhodanese-related sulfurtransferase
MYNSIGINEFEQLTKRKQLSILDVREVDEFQRGHIPTAENLPLSQLGSGELSLKKEETYYVICQAGARSKRACQLLGETYHVTNVMGGMSAWRGDTVIKDY